MNPNSFRSVISVLESYQIETGQSSRALKGDHDGVVAIVKAASRSVCFESVYGLFTTVVARAGILCEGITDVVIVLLVSRY